MAYLSIEQMASMGFKSLGVNVKISDKASIYDAEQISIADNSRIDDFCVLSGKITIGRNVHVTIYCNLAGGEKGITLGDFSTLAYGCHVMSQSSDYSGVTMSNSTIPSQFRDEIKREVIIGKHCIIGTSSVIFPGVILSEGTSVGAMSLVTKNTQPWSIYVGIPAKKIKDRSKELLSKTQNYLSFDKENKRA